MIGPLLWLSYFLRLLIQIPNVRFYVNMGFSDDDRILTEKWYILKVMEQKIIKQFFR